MRGTSTMEDLSRPQGPPAARAYVGFSWHRKTHGRARSVVVRLKPVAAVHRFVVSSQRCRACQQLPGRTAENIFRVLWNGEGKCNGESVRCAIDWAATSVAELT